MKLSEKQKEVIKRMREQPTVSIRFTYDRKLPITCANALIKMGIATYNLNYDGIILTELGKTIEL